MFENRFGFVDELIRLGADIKVDGHHAVVNGGRSLTGATVIATDLRAGAALVLAGLVAEGSTEVRDVEHIDRGYERFEAKLRALGADIERLGDGAARGNRGVGGRRGVAFGRRGADRTARRRWPHRSGRLESLGHPYPPGGIR